MTIPVHMVDEDGIREITATKCAWASTIKQAIEANPKSYPRSDHNKMLLRKLYIALDLREAYEARIKANNRHL